MRAARIGGTSDAPVIKLDGAGQRHRERRPSASTSSPPTSTSTGAGSAPRMPTSRSRGSTIDERALTQFNAMLDGTTADHSLRSTRSPARPACTCRGKGGFVDGVWNGTIDDLFIDDTANINLQLDAPVAVMVSAERVQARCAVPARQGRAAVRRRRRGTRRAGTRAPTRTICRSARSPPDSRRRSSTRARSTPPRTRARRGGAPFIGEARIDLVDAAIRHKLASGRTDVITFGSGFFTLKAEPDADERGSAARRRAARPHLRAACAPIARAPTCIDWPMRGQLQMATGELGFITLYVPEIDRASGHFDADLDASPARSARRRASGVIKLSGAELDLYQLNLALRALEMEARIVSNKLEFSSTREGRRRHARELGQDRMARGPALRRDHARGREPARRRRARGAHRRLARSRLPHRRAATSSSRARSRCRWRASSPPISPTPCCRRRTKGWSGRPRRSKRIRSASRANHDDARRQRDHRNLRPLGAHHRQHHRAHAAGRADARHGRAAGEGRPVHGARAQARHRARPAHLQRRPARRSRRRHPRRQGISRT